MNTHFLQCRVSSNTSMHVLQTAIYNHNDLLTIVLLLILSRISQNWFPTASGVLLLEKKVKNAQVIGIHLLSEKAICSGASGVRAASIEMLYHSAWVPHWDVLGLKLLLCLNWQDKTHENEKLSWGSSTGLIVNIVLGGWNPPKNGLEPRFSSGVRTRTEVNFRSVFVNHAG